MKNSKIILFIFVGVFVENSFNYAIDKNDQIVDTIDSDIDYDSLKELYMIGSEDEHSCFSKIYCYGDLLHTVSLSKIFKDSKTFVDMSLKYEPDQVLANFEVFKTQHTDLPTPENVRQFVEDNFNEKGSELVEWTPPDWVENPEFLNSVKNSDLKMWAKELNEIWKSLGRQMIKKVQINPGHFSIIPVKNPVIVPGGRFLEYYYWDSYWVVKGLLHCEMYETVKGILENFLTLIKNFGFIPNGGRIYYLKRSQPPLLAPMIQLYVDETKSNDFAVHSAPILEQEYNYFMNNYGHEINGHILCSYFSKSLGPRPESYREDYELAENLQTPESKEELYSNIKAAAESGMDFSGRWFITDNGTKNGNLTQTKTRQIIPVELNAYLYQNAKIIAKFYKIANNTLKAKEFDENAMKIAKAIDAVLWNEEEGVWLDYDMINSKQRNYFVPTNLAPLWVESFNKFKSIELSEKILNYLNKTNVDSYPGGVPNTVSNTGEQWDLPNVWPPMQHMLIIGLNNLNTTESNELAYKWATKWVQSNYAAYSRDGKHMYEKYDANEFGGHGGGGEYEVQTGFGWSNGVILDLLAKYGETLKPTNTGNALFKGTTASLIALFLAIFNRII